MTPLAYATKHTNPSSTTASAAPGCGPLHTTPYPSTRLTQKQLYTLYLTPNFSTIATPMYILPATSNPLARASLAHSLRAAAAAELLKHARVIDAEDIYREAERAFDALEALLGDDEEWFFGAQSPGLFDASVFAYTHLLLKEGLVWQKDRLVQALMGRGRLCRHRERVLARCFPGGSE
jgi:metaxin